MNTIDDPCAAHGFSGGKTWHSTGIPGTVMHDGPRTACADPTCQADVEAALAGKVHHCLVGWHFEDKSLHLAQRNGSVTSIICGAMLGLHSSSKGTEPTQHTPWTLDREAWEQAPNKCKACEARVAT
jgi:hypothetical protein